MTEKLYYQDSYLRKFNAFVLSCKRNSEGGYESILDKTAFFPGGGGQEPDIGTLNNFKVLSTREENDVIYHLTDRPLEPGKAVTGTIDWPRRFRKMQNHTGEHLVSGLVFSLYGFDNVGFHMSSNYIVVDFNGVLTDEMIKHVEYTANVVIGRNVKVSVINPDRFTAEKLSYRSKKEIKNNLRIIDIDGYDMCACCAPHLNSTGGIGIIKFLEWERYKGGMRCRIACGLDAYDDIAIKYSNNDRIANFLSAMPNDTASAVERIVKENSALKSEIEELKKTLAMSVANSLATSEGNICVFVEEFGVEGLRCIVNKGMKICPKMCAAFSGNDKDGYIYVIGSLAINMTDVAEDLNRVLLGRGGGSENMIQGSVLSTRKKIEEYFNSN